jgi:hypothetical protein
MVNTPAIASAIGGTIGIMMLVVIIGYEWRLARLVLQASPLQTGALCALDLLLSFSIDSFSENLAMGGGLF